MEKEIKKMCRVEGCRQEQYDEGVCFIHYVLREYWGYELGGYKEYTKNPIRARRKFLSWVKSLDHLRIVELLNDYDYGLEKMYQDTFSIWRFYPKIDDLEDFMKSSVEEK